MRTPVLGRSGPADQPGTQGITVGFCFGDDGATCRCASANENAHTVESRNRKKTLRRSCALTAELICFFISRICKESGHGTSRRARDVMLELSSVFCFHR